MLPVLEQPLESLTHEDITGLLGWPEGETLEFKETLPGENGRTDPWFTGGAVGRYAQEQIFKEIVALANTAGGHVFIGIEESEDRPPIATAIKPLPHCADLATRLKQAAYSLIEPPIPGLNAFGVGTVGDGSGVVVFRVPPSRSAPHRLESNRHCYVRRGDESAPMRMREIQDLTIHLSHRTDELNAQFERAHREFLDWFNKRRSPDDGAIGFRVTAIPVGASLYIDRVHPVADRVLKIQTFPASFAGTTVALCPFQEDARTPIPAFRAARREMRDEGRETWFSAFSNGVVEIRSRLDWSGVSRNHTHQLENVFYLGWILNSVANVAKAARAFAEIAGFPECEYGITLEIRCARRANDHPFAIGHLMLGGRYSHELDSPLFVEEPMELGDRDALVNKVLRDFHDACRTPIPHPGVCTITDWGS